MNLDQHEMFVRLDVSDMYAAIDGLPQQLEVAWQTGMQQPLRHERLKFCSSWNGDLRLAATSADTGSLASCDGGAS